MSQKSESPPSREGRAEGVRVDCEPTSHPITEKPAISQARRSLQIGLKPDEIGQACRGAFLSDRLAEIVIDAAVTRYLLDAGADDEALVLLERIVGNFRETAKTARLFKDVHSKRQAASDAAARDHAAALHEAERAAVTQERDEI